MTQHIQTLIIGAGISGIGNAVHLKQGSPQRDFLIIEARDHIGGTWDLFKYPGIRSDSDMSTFAYRFKPWRHRKVLADAASICEYLQETVDEYGLADKIRFGHRVQTANWNSQAQHWELMIEHDGQVSQWTADFVIGCTGYYNYKKGHLPDFPEQEQFKGEIIHPQFWSPAMDYKGKKVVIIGSGATAITLLPAMAKNGADVTLLQRSPTYIAAVPSIDWISVQLNKVLPQRVVYQMSRARNIALQQGAYHLAKAQPALSKQLLLGLVRLQLRGKVDMKHFTPRYQPWDERLCVVPDGDMFKMLREGQARIETDEIARFVADGIELKSGKVLKADIVVAATGLELQMLGGINATIDGEAVQPNEHMLYQGTLISGVPNFALMIGYTNISWTLRVDIAADYVSRLLNYMDQHHYRVVMAIADESEKGSESLMGGALKSGYVQRANHVMPRQGKAEPWVIRTSYYEDKKALKQATFAEEHLHFFYDKQARPRVKTSSQFATAKKLIKQMKLKFAKTA